MLLVPLQLWNAASNDEIKYQSAPQHVAVGLRNANWMWAVSADTSQPCHCTGSLGVLLFHVADRLSDRLFLIAHCRTETGRFTALLTPSRATHPRCVSFCVVLPTLETYPPVPLSLLQVTLFRAAATFTALSSSHSPQCFAATTNCANVARTRDTNCLHLALTGSLLLRCATHWGIGGSLRRMENLD